MMESNEPPFIKYEEILITKNENKSSKEVSDEDSNDSSSSSEEMEDEEVEDREKLFSTVMAEKEEYTKYVRQQTISKILDFIFVPREIERDGQRYLLRLSRKPATRNEIIELSEIFESYLKERQVKMTGYCPIRRELYDLLFDELIRQATIYCPERGSLLLRVRDEFRMTMTAYEKLYESGVEYGTRKALEAEIEEKKMENEYKQLLEEVARAENRVKKLQAEIDADEAESKEKLSRDQKQHEEKMQFLKTINRQLKEQISYIS